MNSDKAKILIHRALMILGAMLFALFIIIIRLYYLQIFLSEKYTTMANDNRITTRILVPPRGRIYDRNGVTIANNAQNFQALIVAEQTQDIDKTLQAFSQIVNLDEDEIKKIKKEIKSHKSFVPIKIKEKLTWEEVSEILLNITDLSGIIIDEGLSRYYPHQESMAHLLGYVAAVSKSDKRDDPLFNVPGFQIGKSGIEKIYEDKLRGKSGYLKQEVNAVGRIMKEIEKKPGIPGEDITLTIDAELQKYAYELFEDQSGAAIVVDVNTGEILTFVSAPAFNPNTMSQGISHTEWQALLANEKKPLTNKTISGQYSPGSTFKMITAIAGLEEKVINTQTTVPCYGKMVLGNHPFHCWKKEGHGHEDVIDAIAHSCDIFFYEAALKTGIDKIAEVAKRFGLGKKTNTGFQNERAGLMPDTAWKQKRFNERWQGGESVIAGIGQGYILTTPIQLALMTARLANGGYYVEPSFIKLTQEQKEKIKKINVSNSHLETIKKGMYAVVNERQGTAIASRFNLNGKKMAGKTGTTQVKRISLKERQSGIIEQKDLPWKFRNHALFVGYAPHDNPKYAISVIVEHGGSGSADAAPIASKILQKALIIDDKKAKEN